MLIFPAIDLLDGKVVRLTQGRYDAVTVYSDDPLAQAQAFVEAGAGWIHVVDLNGAATGEPSNIDIVRRIAAESGASVQTGGGIRSRETLDRLFDAGVARCVLGTTLVTRIDFVREACDAYGDRIVAGVDARDGLVAIEGWREGTGVEVSELVGELAMLGVSRLVYTDIARDGLQTGVNWRAYQALVQESGMSVVASGGVATLDDIRNLAAIGGGLEGVIAGRALYERSFTLEDAIAVARGESPDGEA